MKSNKKIIISVLCLALVFMGIGFAAFSTALNLSGTATASGTFDVKITNVVLDTSKKTSGATNTTPAVGNNYAVTEQNLSATFSEPGDYITWNITVTNKGTIEAAITVDVNMLNDANGAYKLECDVEEGTVLAPNATTTFPCEMSFDKNHSLTAQEFAALPKDTPINMQVKVSAVQKANYVAPPVEVEHDFIINEDGVLLFYAGSDTQVQVPDSYNGQTITAIGSYAFYNQNAIAIAILDPENNYAVTKAYVLPSAGEQVIANLTAYAANNNVEIATYEDLVAIEYIDNMNDTEGRVRQAYIPITSSLQPCSSYNITSLDLSNAVHLEKIYSRVIANNVESVNTPRGSLQTLILPTNGVLSEIGAGAFYGNNITSLTLPNSMTTIGNHAFAYNNISTMNFGTSIETIEDLAFALNNIGTTLTLPSSVEYIGQMAFSANNINSIIIGTGTTKSNIETIEDDAFGGDNQNTSYQGVSYYQNNVTSVTINLTSAEWALVDATNDAFEWASGYSNADINLVGHN